MKIEERLHDAMHEYADTIEPEPGSWAKISDRFDEPPTPSRPARGGLVFAGVALTLVVALIAVLVVRDDSDDDTRIATGPAAGMPARILAVTEGGQPVVLDSASGEQQATFKTTGVAEGTQIAAGAERDIYLVRGNGNEGCADHTLVRLPLADGAGVAKLVSSNATDPAVSPDGRFLAYLHCLPGDNRADEIVLRDLTTGDERVTPASQGTFFINHLEFAADSRRVFVALFDDAAGNAAMREIDIVGGEAAPGRQLGIAAGGQGWVGVRGTTGEYLGVKGTPPSVLHLAEVGRDPTGFSFFSAGPLFTVPTVPTQVVSDRSGRHILAVVDQSLYRWSEGENEPTKIAAGVMGATWIPDPAPAPPAAVGADSVAVIGGNRLVLIDGTTGSVSRELFSHPEITSVTPAIDGNSVYVITNDPGPCRGGPQTFRVPLDGGDPKNLDLTGITSLVEIPTTDGTRIAYTGDIDCSDAGRLIGFGTLADPRIGLGDAPEVRFPGDATEVKILDASPDGQALLVRVVRPASAGLFVVDIATQAVTGVPGTESVTVGALTDDAQYIWVVRDRDARARADLIDREGRILSSHLVPTDILAIDVGTGGFKGLLGSGPDGSLVRWQTDGARLSYVDVSGRVTSAAWIPEEAAAPSASTDAPGAILAAVGNRLAFLASSNGSEQITYGSFLELSGVSVTPNGREIVFSYLGRSGACGDEPTSEVDRMVTEPNSPATRIVGGAVTPVVSPDGKYVAYGITCDGPTLGFTDLATGENYRAVPLDLPTRVADPKNIERVEVLGWSPNSRRVLYRLTLSGDPEPHYYVGQFMPLVNPFTTKVVEIPGPSGITAAAFVDDETVALATASGTGARVIKRRIGPADSRVPLSTLFDRTAAPLMFTAPNPITALVPDPSGRHFLALVSELPRQPAPGNLRNLYRWSVGDEAPTKIADNVTAASWTPWW